MFKRIWGWLLGNSQVDLNISVEIKDLDKILPILLKLSNHPVIIDKGTGHIVQEQHIKAATPSYTPQSKIKKKLDDDPLSAAEMANIFAAGGIEKAIDKTGDSVYLQSEGSSTDNKVSSLKGLIKGNQK